jgi:ABC-type Fe3+-siderophore transport system permease subunit
MRKLSVAVTTAIATIAFSGTIALAADLGSPIDTTIDGGVAVGEQVELTVVSSGPFAGQTCTVQSIHGGAGAPHPGNDLVVSSGEQVSTLVDVERSAGAVTVGSAPITLGDTIAVGLTMGPDGRFEGDVVVEIDCGSGMADEDSSLPITGSQTTTGLTIGIALVLAGLLLVWVASDGRAGTSRAGASGSGGT